MALEMSLLRALMVFLGLNLFALCGRAEASAVPAFKVIAFHTGRNDQAHISFVHEANRWFLRVARQHHFSYEATTNWADLNTNFLSRYQVVLFLDTPARSY